MSAAFTPSLAESFRRLPGLLVANGGVAHRVVCSQQKTSLIRLKKIGN